MAANPVNYENRDGIGVIIVNNPPLNALSPGSSRRAPGRHQAG